MNTCKPFKIKNLEFEALGSHFIKCTVAFEISAKTFC